MGIYDREYYRREGPSFLQMFAGRGRVCKWLILVNICIFVIQLVTEQEGGWFTEILLLKPQAVMEGQVWRLLSYAFLHDPGSLLHIVFNMLFLWWFGGDVEDLYGSREFLSFYLMSAVLGGIVFTAWQATHDALTPCLGASGAVTAVMVLYAIHYPARKIYLYLLIPIPIWLFVGFQVFQDVYLFVGNRKTTTAVTVHLAGAAFGLIYYKTNMRLVGFWTSMRSWWKQQSGPRLRIYTEQEKHSASVVTRRPSGSDEQIEAKLDAVLEKVARSGQDSLTESEKQILMRASEVYRRRRT